MSGATPACPQPLAPPTPRGLALNPALGLSGHGATDPVPCTPPPEADCFLQRGPGRSWQDACCGPPPCTAWRGGSLACAACRRAPAARPVGLLVQRRRADLVLGRGLKIGEKEERSASTPIPALLWAGIPRRLRFVASLPLQARRNGFAPPAGAGSPRLESWESGDSDGAAIRAGAQRDGPVHTEGPPAPESKRARPPAPARTAAANRRREPPARTAGAEPTCRARD